MSLLNFLASFDEPGIQFGVEERMSEDKGTAALFGEMPALSEGGRAAPARRAAPRLQQAVRDQVELRAFDVEPL